MDFLSKKTEMTDQSPSKSSRFSAKPAQSNHLRQKNLPQKKHGSRRIKKELVVLGYHALCETLHAGRTLKYIAINENSEISKRRYLLSMCRQKKIPVRILPRATMESTYKNLPHHGFIGELKSTVKSVESLEKFIATNQEKNSLIVLLDSVSDQQNLGAMIRSCYFFGAALMIFEVKNSAPIDHLTHRAAAGASLKQKFYWATKLSEALETLKKYRFKIIGAVTNTHPQAKPHTTMRLDAPTVLILGSEENGLRPHVLRFCDQLITIGSQNHFDSLNVSVSLGILLAELTKKKKQEITKIFAQRPTNENSP